MKHLPLKRMPSEFNCRVVVEDSSMPISDPCYNRERVSKPIDKDFKIISSVYGKMKTLVLFYPTNKDNRNKSTYCYFEFLKDLFARFEEGGRTFILVTKENVLNKLSDIEKKELRQLASTNEIHFVSISQRQQLTPWARDAFLALNCKNEQTSYLIEPINEYNHDNHDTICRVLNKIEQQKVKPKRTLKSLNSDLEFVGGNVLVGDTFVLMGIHQTSEDNIHKCSEWFGKNIILLNSDMSYLIEYFTLLQRTGGYKNKYRFYSDNQAIYHLDLFITLAGKNHRCEEVFVIGEPVVGFPIDQELDHQTKDLIKTIITETSKGIDIMIDQLKQELDKLNISYQIVRTPLPLTYYDNDNNQNDKIRHWQWASYNNCLVEYYYEKRTDQNPIKRVFLPSYGIRSNYRQFAGNRNYGDWSELYVYDLQNQWIWESKLGYKAILLHHDYNQFMKINGSLHCLTNCVEREQ